MLPKSAMQSERTSEPKYMKIIKCRPESKHGVFGLEQPTFEVLLMNAIFLTVWSDCRRIPEDMWEGSIA